MSVAAVSVVFQRVDSFTLSQITSKIQLYPCCHVQTKPCIIHALWLHKQQRWNMPLESWPWRSSKWVSQSFLKSNRNIVQRVHSQISYKTGVSLRFALYWQCFSAVAIWGPCLLWCCEHPPAIQMLGCLSTLCLGDNSSSALQNNVFNVDNLFWHVINFADVETEKAFEVVSLFK